MTSPQEGIHPDPQQLDPLEISIQQIPENTQIEPLPPISNARNHLRIYVIPCDRKGKQWYFYPQFIHSPPSKLEKFQKKEKEKFKGAEPKTWRAKMWARYQKQVEKELPSEKMVKRLPKNIKTIEFVYPEGLNSDQLLMILKKQVVREGNKKKRAAIGF